MVSKPVVAADPVEALAKLLAHRRFAVLTGAGCSTESGIPDYRGPNTRRRARNPIQHRAFVTDPEARRRYWARSLQGWPRIRDARPNPAHLALAELERRGLITGLITQNVDRLHLRAGHREVIELHGAIHEVRCLSCGTFEKREEMQARLLAANEGHEEVIIDEVAPDGDAEIDGAVVGEFQVVGCEACGGVLMPNVVFFGGAVPRDRVERGYAHVDASEALLVVGSSLEVFSGLRFVRRAAERGYPVAIVNLTETRGDPQATLRVMGSAGQILPELVRRFG